MCFFRVGSYVVGVSPTFQVGKMGVGRDEHNCIFWVNISSYLYSTVHMSRPTDRLTDRPIDPQTNWPTNQKIDRPTDTQTLWLIELISQLKIALQENINSDWNCSAIYLFNVPDFGDYLYKTNALQIKTVCRSVISAELKIIIKLRIQWVHRQMPQ